ncbi:hypothetical protein [Cereibacter changlensis]|uniref:hypothetical protein n=1 Tax=Cereibacter changlensis TaxID=402884 RepID=UPI0040339A20
MTFQFDSNLITQAQTINEVAFTKYSPEDIHKALDCAVSISGVADRIIFCSGASLRFDEVKNTFSVFASTPHSFARWYSISTSAIAAIIKNTVNDLYLELAVVADAKRAGIIDIDQAAYAEKVIRFQAEFDNEKSLKVIEILKSKLNGIQPGKAVPHPLTQALFDASR